MKTSTSYTSTLPVELAHQLDELSRRLKIPKNKIIEISLRRHFEDLRRQEFIEGFKRAAQDPEMLLLAEEGLADYREQLDRL